MTEKNRVWAYIPYLLACALVANAASFVLPISNPANLVVFGKQLPPLLTWFERFALPSAASVVITFIVLRLTYRKAIGRPIHSEIEAVTLSVAGRGADVRRVHFEPIDA